jgi:dCMP deaminase
MNTLQVSRPTWDEYFMLDAIRAATRASCYTRCVGAAVVDPETKRTLSTGYNGAPPKTKNCFELGSCEYRQVAWDDAQGDRGKFEALATKYKSICNAAHAETNALSQLAQQGGSARGKTLYCTNFPCGDCARDEILAKGLAELVYWRDYDPKNTTLDAEKENQRTMAKLEGAGVIVRRLEISDIRLQELLQMMFGVGQRTGYVFESISK